MTFANPWWLLGLAAMVPVVVLHILRSQRSEVSVSSVLDWEDLDRPTTATRPWQRLRWSVPLLLQLLVVALVSLSLAGLSRDTGKMSAEHLVVIVDTSASMAATDGSPTRLDDARAVVRDLLDDLGVSTTVSVIDGGAPASIVATDASPAEISRRLDGLRAREGGFDTEAATSLAASLDRPDRSTEFALVSDGRIPAESLRLFPRGTRYLPVGTSDRNVGITNVVTSRAGQQLHVQATLTNASRRSVAATARFDVDGHTADTTSVEVPAGGSAEVAATVDDGSRVEVLLVEHDLLRLDDHAYAVAPDEAVVQVAVVGPPSLFLDAVLDASPGLEAVPMTEVEALAPGGLASVDVAVFNQVAVPNDIAVPYLAIAAPAGTGAVTVGPAVENPIATLVRGDTDVMADLDLREFAAAQAQTLNAPAATTLVGDEHTPLIVSGRDGDVAFVYLGFTLEASNFGLLPAFPVFVDRALATLGQTQLVSGSLRPGDRLPVTGAGEGTLVSPSGTEIPVVAGSATPVLDRTGFWTVRFEGQPERLVVVNPAPSETSLAPRADLGLPGGRPLAEADSVPVLRSLKTWLGLAAIAAIAAEWWFSRRRRGVTRSQWRWAERARLAVGALLVLGLVLPSIPLPSRRVAVVVVADVSASLGSSTDAVESVVAEVFGARGRNDVAAVVAVDANAHIDASLSTDWKKFSTTRDPQATDLAGGLRVAGALVPTDRASRIVVISDGRPTTGDATSEIDRLRDADIPVDVVTVEPMTPEDLAVVSVDVASRVRTGDRVDVAVSIEATTPQQTSVELRANDEIVGTKVVDAPAGRSEVRFDVAVPEATSIRWRATVAGPANGRTENDRAGASTRIEGVPNVLVVEGFEGSGSAISAALGAAGNNVSVLAATALSSISQLATVDIVVLADVAAKDFSRAQMTIVDQAVRELGVGLLAVGGTNSFSAADYLGSDLEALLPVTSEAKDPKRRSRLAQVFAVDTSGSMGACHCADDADGDNSRLEGGVRKTDIAHEAIELALGEFRPDDQAGVLGLDSSFRWLAPLAPVGDAADLGKAIGGLAPDSAGSGTKLGSALDEAAAALRNSDTGLRHVVLFTDGFVDQGQFTKLEADAAALREEGITVSVFGTGEGAARQLQSIATAGGGRFYAGRDLKELPDLLLEETKVVARQLIVEGEFVPERTSNAAIVSRLDAAPVLRGYLATTERPTATVHLRIGEDRDPLLATWQVGLGRTAAWTSDGGTRWAAGWSGWDGAVTFWSDLVRSLAPQPAGEVSMRFGERETMLVATFGDDVPDGATVNATVTSPDGTAQVVTMRRIDQRTFEAEAPTGPAGSYTAAVTAEVRGSAVGSMSAVAERGFSDEFLARSADRDWMQTLSSSTGGRGEIAASAAFERTGTRKGERDLDLRWMMLLLGLIGWIAAIAIGRLRFRSGALAIVRASDRAKAVPGLDAVGARRARAAKDRASAIEGSAERAQATSAPVPPSQPPPPASETPPPASEASSGPSSLDSLLEAKRRRSRGS